MDFSQAGIREIKRKYLDIVHFQPICCYLGPLVRRSLGIALGDLGQLAIPDTHSLIIRKYLSLQNVIKIRSFVWGGINSLLDNMSLQSHGLI